MWQNQTRTRTQTQKTFGGLFAPVRVRAKPETDWCSHHQGCGPYLIYTANQLAGLAQLVNNGASFKNKTITQADDIDLFDYQNWTPIGTKSNPFQGIFDGDGHTVTGLSVTTSEWISVGLFGNVEGATVRHLGVEDAVIVGIMNAGGVVGELFSGSVINCYSTGSVHGGYDGTGGVGGVIGLVRNSNVTSCFSTAIANGEENVGGVIGKLYDSRNLTKCYSTGRVNGSKKVGGVVGWVHNNCKVTTCYFTGSVSGVTRVGGVAGLVVNSSGLINCYSTAEVRGSQYVGGVAGFVDGNGIMGVKDCAALNPSVNGRDAGRVVGYVNNSSITSCLAWSDMRLNGSSVSGVSNSNKNGGNITARALNKDGTIGELFDGNPWTTENGSLPGLFDETVEMPEHLWG